MNLLSNPREYYVGVSYYNSNEQTRATTNCFDYVVSTELALELC